MYVMFQKCSTYEELFVRALQDAGIICIGLYRLLDLDYNVSQGSPDGMESTSTKRYVITNPTKGFKTLSTDMVRTAMIYGLEN